MSTTDNLLKQFVKDIERDLLFHIIWDLKRGEVTLDEVEKLAKKFTSSLPVTNRQTLLRVLAELSRDYKEARAVFLKYALPYEQKKRSRSLWQTRKAIKGIKGGETS